MDASARDEIVDLLGRYAHAVDHGRFADAAATFTAEGVLDVAGTERTVGQASIARRFERAGQNLAEAASDGVPFVRHHVSSITVEFDASGDRAEVVSYFLVLTEVGLDHWGRYRDTVVRDTDGKWRFAERNVKVEGRTGPSRMVRPAP